MSNEMQDEKDAIAGKQLAEDAEKKVRRAEWEEPELVAEHRSIENQRERAAKIDLFTGRVDPAKKRECPGCGEQFPNNKSWVLNLRKRLAICRSCFSARYNTEIDPTPDKIDIHNLFDPVPAKYTVNKEHFKRQREKVGLSCSGFAAAMGWSPAYQHKLESGEAPILRYKADLMILVIEKMIKRNKLLAGKEVVDKVVRLRHTKKYKSTILED